MYISNIEKAPKKVLQNLSKGIFSIVLTGCVADFGARYMETESSPSSIIDDRRISDETNKFLEKYSEESSRKLISFACKLFLPNKVNNLLQYEKKRKYDENVGYLKDLVIYQGSSTQKKLFLLEISLFLTKCESDYSVFSNSIAEQILEANDFTEDEMSKILPCFDKENMFDPEYLDYIVQLMNLGDQAKSQIFKEALFKKLESWICKLYKYECWEMPMRIADDKQAKEDQKVKTSNIILKVGMCSDIISKMSKIRSLIEGSGNHSEKYFTMHVKIWSKFNVESLETKLVNMVLGGFNNASNIMFGKSSLPMEEAYQCLIGAMKEIEEEIKHDKKEKNRKEKERKKKKKQIKRVEGDLSFILSESQVDKESLFNS